VEDDRLKVNRDFAPHGSYELIVHDVRESDAGEYSAAAENTVGKEECKANVTAKDAKVN